MYNLFNKFREFANFAIMDGLLFVTREEKLIVEHLIMLHLKFYKEYNMI